MLVILKDIQSVLYQKSPTFGIPKGPTVYHAKRYLMFVISNDILDCQIKKI